MRLIGSWARRCLIVGSGRRGGGLGGGMGGVIRGFWGLYCWKVMTALDGV